ncbi:uncharacterized protein LOC133195358 [Saccostrea echinata]|uniref:uncharacterized protein LOC133195358 n=1 Tax=Saccostrea echinata TaxID=191078 RepID=UPI002A807C75|nr:uncharacterized protein LOC133195358 [Saccostrea echinata]
MGLLGERKRKNSRGLHALAEGSLSFARAHAVLNETERSLEHEIERENRKPPKSKLGKIRYKGEKLMHTKWVLLTIVLLNILDCILVMGELILDIYYLKGVVDHDETAALKFVTDMKSQYPDALQDYKYDYAELDNLHRKILSAQVDFNSAYSPRSVTETTVTITTPIPMLTTLLTKDVTTATFASSLNSERRKRAANSPDDVNKTGSDIVENHVFDHHSIEVDLAHYFHYCSIAILAILAVENVLKLFSSGKEYFKNKLEVFDGFIVVASFIVDLVFIKGLSAYKVQLFVVILAFLVPWRVVRVVNSLVVAVIDHEHFRMKLMYKQKKQIAAELKSAKANAKDLQICFEAMRKLAYSAGVSAKHIDAVNALHPDSKSKKKGLAGFASSFAKQNIQRQISSSTFGSSFTLDSTASNNNTDSNGANNENHI